MVQSINPAVELDIRASKGKTCDEPERIGSGTNLELEIVPFFCFGEGAPCYTTGLFGETQNLGPMIEDFPPTPSPARFGASSGRLDEVVLPPCLRAFREVTILGQLEMYTRYGVSLGRSCHIATQHFFGPISPDNGFQARLLKKISLDSNGCW